MEVTADEDWFQPQGAMRLAPEGDAGGSDEEVLEEDVCEQLAVVPMVRSDSTGLSSLTTLGINAPSRTAREVQAAMAVELTASITYGVDDEDVPVASETAAVSAPSTLLAEDRQLGTLVVNQNAVTRGDFVARPVSFPIGLSNPRGENRKILQNVIRRSSAHVRMDKVPQGHWIAEVVAAPSREAKQYAQQHLELLAAEFEAESLKCLNEGETESHSLSNESWAYDELDDMDEHVASMAVARRRLHKSSNCQHDVVHPVVSCSMLDHSSFQVSLPLWFELPCGFQLDEFQKQAGCCIMHNESTLIAAHTSAGKTIVGEMALRSALHAKRRGIFTTPIKALSNQKFQELVEKFGANVGLMTGDVSINCDASMVVMTTEILQGMLYKLPHDPNCFDDFGWVVFDEAQFIGDPERGPSWEDAMILMPDHVRFILLAATIPNVLDVATWLARIRLAPCHIISAPRRPVPLNHGLFRAAPGSGRDLVMVHTASGKLLTRNLDELLSQLESNRKRKLQCPAVLVGKLIGKGGSNLKRLRTETGADINIDKGSNDIKVTGSHEAAIKAHIALKSWFAQHGHHASGAVETEDGFESHLERLLEKVVQRRGLPMIGFVFSRRQCEEIAIALSGAKQIDLSSGNDRAEIQKLYEEGIAKLEPDDRALKQLQTCLLLLKRGFGVHHSGMLPLVRELIEICFMRKLTKCVFATETFAIGMNMPAKTVVFCGLSKFDGLQHRSINTGEFRQMAGRAGRRGIDKKGTAIIMAKSSNEHQQQLRNLLPNLYQGVLPPVESHYRLRWGSLLVLLQQSHAHIDMLMKQSFRYHMECQVGKQAAQATKWRKEHVQGMVDVLQDLVYIDAECGLLLKGRVASRLAVLDNPIPLTELLFATRGFETLNPPQVFAICSCFIVDGRCEPTKVMDGKLLAQVRRSQRLAMRVCEHLHRKGLDCMPGDMCGGCACDGRKFVMHHVNPRLVETVFIWAEGEPFARAVERSGVHVGGEGLVVRAVRRLDELVRQVQAVLRDLMDRRAFAADLQILRTRIRRGILIAPSLYLGHAEDRTGEELEEEVSDNVRLAAVGSLIEISPFDVGFSQRTCGLNYKDGHTILGNARELIDETLAMADLPKIEVYWHRRQWYTLANRRLAAFRLAALALPLASRDGFKISVRVIGRQRAIKHGWTKKFQTGFTAGRRIRIGGTGSYIGCTRESSSFGESLWATCIYS